MADWRSMRASGTDRERAADLLRAAHGDGRLPWPEYSARLERLMSSTTHGEIHQVVADLVQESARQNSNGHFDNDNGQAPGRAAARPAGGWGSGAGIPRTGPGQRPPAGYHSGTDRLASAAVLCGTLVPFTLGISGIPAVLLGHLVRRRLKRAPELSANGNSAQMAIAALVLGYFPVVVGLGILVFLFTR